jgi:hypothetical protein
MIIRKKLIVGLLALIVFVLTTAYFLNRSSNNSLEPGTIDPKTGCMVAGDGSELCEAASR